MKPSHAAEKTAAAGETTVSISSVISETMLLWTSKLIYLKGKQVEGDKPLGETLGEPIIKLKTLNPHGTTAKTLKGAVIRAFRTTNKKDFFLVENGPAEILFESAALIGQALASPEARVCVRFERDGKQVDAWIVPAKTRLTDLDA
jgi:hypothetical protein